LLADAAPYVILDSEDGQSVYRLAPRTFQEVFVFDEADHHGVALALLADAAADDEPLNPYIARHLSGHVGAARPEAWERLAAEPGVLDRLDPRADALRTAFGRLPRPAAIAGVLGARHLPRDAAPGDRRGVREVAMARHAAELVRAIPVGIPIRAMTAVDDGLAIASEEGFLQIRVPYEWT
jgi:hypothetical protein